MTPLSTRFDPILYEEFRPDYPSALFSKLESVLQTRSKKVRTILDVGCGTGRSLASLSLRFPEAHACGVDRDPSMLRTARSQNPNCQFLEGTAEILPVADRTTDLLTVGSAIHWFDRERFEREARRVLNADGFLFVFEYQFPKAPSAPSLNEWVRRGFNQRWRAPGQTPRGNLRDLLAPFFQKGWTPIPFEAPKMILPLGPAELFGQIISQSRYLHSESGLSEQEISSNRENLFRELRVFFQSDVALEFDFKLSAHLFAFPQ